MSEENNKPKINMAVYWGAACGGCCVSVLDVHEAVFDVVASADLVFWPRLAWDLQLEVGNSSYHGYILKTFAISI